MTCPCGLEAEFDDCCGRYIRGDALPPTAEALMRSRYSAFAVGAVDWVVDTHDPRTRDVERDAIAQWSTRAQWLGLVVLETEEGGPDDTRGIVVFEAHYFDGVRKVHRERSSFTKEGERWLYVNGTAPTESSEPRRVSRVGRNEPCPCGSGRKYKKCCGRPGGV